jgi:hypothetical protein
VLGRAGRGAVAQRLDGQQVGGRGELGVVELGLVEGHGGAHGVDQHDGRLPGVVRAEREGVAGLDTAQVGDLDGCFGCHLFLFLLL